MKAIVAINNQNYIGKDGKLLWKCKEDFKHFKSMTMGGILIVGAVTFEKDLNSKVLSGRDMIVIGSKIRNPEYHSLYEGVMKAIMMSMANKGDRREIWLIGGQSIYEQLLPMCDEVHISVINDDQVGDRKFVLPASYKGNVITYSFEPDDPFKFSNGLDNRKSASVQDKSGMSMEIVNGKTKIYKDGKIYGEQG